MMISNGLVALVSAKGAQGNCIHLGLAIYANWSDVRQGWLHCSKLSLLLR
jgi:hypothetical protein